MNFLYICENFFWPAYEPYFDRPKMLTLVRRFYCIILTKMNLILMFLTSNVFDGQCFWRAMFLTGLFWSTAQIGQALLYNSAPRCIKFLTSNVFEWQCFWLAMFLILINIMFYSRWSPSSSSSPLSWLAVCWTQVIDFGKNWILTSLKWTLFWPT